MTDRTALLINCSAGEAAAIRHHAELERRTVSGYVLNIVMRAVTFEAQIRDLLKSPSGIERTLSRLPLSAPGPRTTVLLRCSAEEAAAIRAAAKRRSCTISGFVLHALRRSWSITGPPDQPLPPSDLPAPHAQFSRRGMP
jgi:uncharacterized protein (DUF1778 family)